MNLDDQSIPIQIMPDSEIFPDQDLSQKSDPNIEKDNLDVLIAADLQKPLVDDDLFENTEKEEYKPDSPNITSEEQVKETIEVKPIQKPIKKVKKKRKPLSAAHAAALARGRKKALENRRRKAAIRKQLKAEKKAEQDKKIDYELENFRKQKKIKEIERKNILLNEKLDLNSVDKFFTLMDRYERLKTHRKNEYYKQKLRLKQRKYTMQQKPQQIVQQKEPKILKKKPINKNDPFGRFEPPSGPYADLWS